MPQSIPQSIYSDSSIVKQYSSIDDVIRVLDEIIKDATNKNNFMGVFAYLYRRTTQEIRNEIAKGSFDDNERMEKFDIEFANFYISAYKSFQEGEPICRAWEISFRAASDRISILQHMLLGMNAHINLDLGIAAAKVMHGKDIDELENDFMRVNQILAGLIDEMQNRIARVSRLMKLIDWLGGRQDEKLVSLNINKARNNSWLIAKELWKMNEMEMELRKKQLDEEVTRLSFSILRPKFLPMHWCLKVISIFEDKSVQRIIYKLED